MTLAVPNGSHSGRIEKYFVYGDTRNASDVASTWCNPCIPYPNRIFCVLERRKWNVFPVAIGVHMVWMKGKTELRMVLFVSTYA